MQYALEQFRKERGRAAAVVPESTGYKGQRFVVQCFIVGVVADFHSALQLCRGGPFRRQFVQIHMKEDAACRCAEDHTATLRLEPERLHAFRLRHQTDHVTPCSVLDITVSNAQLLEIQIV
jgi:hypothetical protein